MDCSTPGFPVLHCLLEFAQTQVRWVSDAIHPTISSSVVPFSSCLQSFPESGSFPMSQLFTSGGQSIALQHQSFQWIFRVNLLEDQLVWTPCCPRDSPESSAVRKHQFVGTQPSLCSNSYIFTWLLGWKSKVKVLAKPCFLCWPSLPLFNLLVIAGDPWYSLVCAVSL